MGHVGHIKGVGHIYQQTFIDTYAKIGFAKLYDRETNILFGCQKLSGECSSQDMGDNPIVQQWWDYMADIMDVNPDNSPVSIPLKEVFHME